MNRTSTSAPLGYLTQDEAISMLTPWVTCRAHIHQEWMAGRLGSEKRLEFLQVGRRRFYKVETVEALLKKYKDKTYSPVRYEKSNAA